jgi:hypothetical protein
MKIQIDLKSALCGLIIGVAAMFVMGAESSSSNSPGKYRAVTGYTGSYGYALILNTQTGEAWGMPSGEHNFDNKSDKFFGPKSQ